MHSGAGSTQQSDEQRLRRKHTATELPSPTIRGKCLPSFLFRVAYTLAVPNSRQAGCNYAVEGLHSA